jgi:hypothetical protein
VPRDAARCTGNKWGSGTGVVLHSLAVTSGCGTRSTTAARLLRRANPAPCRPGVGFPPAPLPSGCDRTLHGSRGWATPPGRGRSIRCSEWRAQASTAYQRPLPSRRQPDLTGGSGQSAGWPVTRAVDQAMTATSPGLPRSGIVDHGDDGTGRPLTGEHVGPRRPAAGDHPDAVFQAVPAPRLRC